MVVRRSRHLVRKAERAGEQLDVMKKTLLELSEGLRRTMLGPYSFCKASEPLLASLATRSRPPARACAQALPLPGMFQLLGMLEKAASTWSASRKPIIACSLVEIGPCDICILHMFI